MFGKGKSAGEGWKAQPPQRLTLSRSATALPLQTISSLSSEMTVVGKIVCKDVLKIYGFVEGEVIASNALIAEGARIQGDIVVEELTVAGRVKGEIYALRVKLQVLLSSRVTSITDHCRWTRMPASKDAHGQRTILPSHGPISRLKARTHTRSCRP
jgi:Polymer-forming cytoskeletal